MWGATAHSTDGGDVERIRGLEHGFYRLIG